MQWCNPKLMIKNPRIRELFQWLMELDMHETVHPSHVFKLNKNKCQYVATCEKCQEKYKLYIDSVPKKWKSHIINGWHENLLSFISNHAFIESFQEIEDLFIVHLVTNT